MPIRRYRYSKRRWRALVRVLDGVGGLALRLWRRFRPVREVDCRRLVVVQLDHLGDAVLSSPIFPRLRAAYPGASIDVLCSPSSREVFEADPNIDGVLVADRSWFDRRTSAWSWPAAAWALGGRLRGRGYDLGIDVRGDVLTVLVLALAGIPRRLGWAMGGGGFLLTDVADWVPGRHEVAARMALLDRLGIPRLDPVRVAVHASDEARLRVARRLRAAWPDRRRRPVRVAVGPTPASPLPQRDAIDDPDRLHAGRFGDPSPLLAIHPGAGTAAKRWPASHWRALIGRFLDDGWRVVLVGGPDDHLASDREHPNLRDWTGLLSVTETTALLERADLFLGADSGPAHLASAAGTPSVVLFSGTNLVRQWRPWSRRSLVLRRRVACRPCHRKTCPLADHPCLDGLGPDVVARAARRWWDRLHRAEARDALV